MLLKIVYLKRNCPSCAILVYQRNSKKLNFNFLEFCLNYYITS